MSHELEHGASFYARGIHRIAHARHLAHDGLTLIGAIDVAREILSQLIERADVIARAIGH